DSTSWLHGVGSPLLATLAGPQATGCRLRRSPGVASPAPGEGKPSGLGSGLSRAHRVDAVLVIRVVGISRGVAVGEGRVLRQAMVGGLLEVAGPAGKEVAGAGQLVEVRLAVAALVDTEGLRDDRLARSRLGAPGHIRDLQVHLRPHRAHHLAASRRGEAQAD